MSHVTAVTLEIKDLDALKGACRELDLQFVEGLKSFRWYGHYMNDSEAARQAIAQGIAPSEFGKCEHGIRVPGSDYDIGVARNPKGSGFILAFDSWGRGRGEVITAKLGTGLEKLKQLYAVHAATNAAKKRGWLVRRETGKAGAVQLVVSGC